MHSTNKHQRPHGSQKSNAREPRPTGSTKDTARGQPRPNGSTHATTRGQAKKREQRDKTSGQPASHTATTRGQPRPEGSHGQRAAKKCESHGQKAANKVMIEYHGQMAPHMPRLESRQKSKASQTRPQVSLRATAKRQPKSNAREPWPRGSTEANNN